MAILSDTAEEHPAGEVSVLLQQFRRRFVDGNESHPDPTGNAFIDGLVRSYREYWRLALMHRMPPPDAEQMLRQNLLHLIGDASEDWRTGPGGSLATLGDRIGAEGYHHFAGAAPPVEELFLWKRQERMTYTVSLTDESRSVEVVFMDDFFSLGWKHYATLGLAGTTGWVDGDVLFCVAWAYDRQSENFRISYLKHETRHLVDFEQFPGLPAVELEYRAKLTELAFASSTQRRLLADFFAKSAENPHSPHAHANYRVTRDLYRQLYGDTVPANHDPWQQVSTDRVNRAARSLLQQNTEMLRERP